MTTQTSHDSRILELPQDARAAGLARQFVRETLEVWQREDLEGSATLAVSELVTNAVLHAESATRITLLNHGDSIQMRVHDSSGSTPRRRNAGPDDTCGRGMMLIEALSSHWGIENETAGKTVWLDLTQA